MSDKLNPWFLSGGCPSFSKVPKPEDIRRADCRVLFVELISRVQEIEKCKDSANSTSIILQEENAIKLNELGSKPQSNKRSRTEACKKDSQITNLQSIDKAFDESEFSKKVKGILQDANLLLQAVQEEKQQGAVLTSKIIELL